MKIGIIGSGEVGQSLARGFLKYGYEVMIGTNNKAKVEELKSKVGAKAAVGSFEQVARFGELVVLAVKGSAAEAARREHVRGHARPQRSRREPRAGGRRGPADGAGLTCAPCLARPSRRRSTRSWRG